jgi:hypothetical protein
MATLRARINAFFNPPTQETGDRPAPVLTDSDLSSRFKVENDRASVVKDCRLMYDADPRVEKMHRDYARDLVKNGFIVRTADASAKQIAMDLQTRLSLNQKLEDWARLSMRDGDSFLEATVNDDLVISKVTRKPTLSMHRNSNNADEFDHSEKAFWMASGMWYSEPPKEALWFPEWKIIHARWNHDEESRYGRPMMKSARKHFKYVDDGELNVAVRRKIGGAQIRHHVVEGSASDVEAYKEVNKATLGKLAAVIDFFTNKPGSLSVIQGDGNLDKIGDVSHHIATMFTASEIPMELIAYGSDMNRDVLSEKKDQYGETLRQGREWLTTEIIKPLLERQWLLHGILPANIQYKIIWRTALSLTPEGLRNLTDGMMRLRLLGVKDELIGQLLAQFLPEVDADILSGDGIDSERFAQMLQGLSI